jgi:hypothetical protein
MAIPRIQMLQPIIIPGSNPRILQTLWRSTDCGSNSRDLEQKHKNGHKVTNFAKYSIFPFIGE